LRDNCKKANSEARIIFYEKLLWVYNTILTTP
jgi:hypothetical protein